MPTPDQTKAEKPLAESRDAFTFRLKNELLKNAGNKNICFSPISLQICLSMLLNGTSGASVDPLRKTLSIGSIPLDQVNQANKALADSLAGPNVSLANSLWLRSEVQPNPDFTKQLQDFYGAESFMVPRFDESTYGRIDAWTKEHTDGKIERLFDRRKSSAVTILINTAVFAAHWDHEFDPGKTQPVNFTLSNGSKPRFR